MPKHPIILVLRERRSNRLGDQGVLWKELDLVLDLLEVVMESITQTQEALDKLKADSEARDAATSAAITDLKAEVAKVETAGADTTAINASIDALDAAVKTGTSEAQAADPGSQQAPAPPASMTQPGYWYDSTVPGATQDPRFSPSGLREKGTLTDVLYFSGDPANQTAQATGDSVLGYVRFTGEVEKATAAA